MQDSLAVLCKAELFKESASARPVIGWALMIVCGKFCLMLRSLMHGWWIKSQALQEWFNIFGPGQL